MLKDVTNCLNCMFVYWIVRKSVFHILFSKNIYYTQPYVYNYIHSMIYSV